MKKIIFTFLILSVFFFTSCVPSVETETDKSPSYIYIEKEDIKVVDKRDSSMIGTLVIEGIYILKNEPFTVKHYIGEKEDGTEVYEDIEYQQLIQVYFIFDNEPNYSKNIDAENFKAADNNASINPDMDYEKNPVKGTKSFVIAMKEKNQEFIMYFTYDIWQKDPTAKIKLDLTKQITDTPAPTATPESTPALTPARTESPEENKENKITYNQLAVMNVLFFVIIIVLVILLVLAKRKKKEN